MKTKQIKLQKASYNRNMKQLLHKATWQTIKSPQTDRRIRNSTLKIDSLANRRSELRRTKVWRHTHTHTYTTFGEHTSTEKDPRLRMTPGAKLPLTRAVRISKFATHFRNSPPTFLRWALMKTRKFAGMSGCHFRDGPKLRNPGIFRLVMLGIGGNRLLRVER